MMQLPCSKCDKKGTFQCTIPNVASSLTYTIGNPESGAIGLNFFEQDSKEANEAEGKTMYLAPITADFTEPIAIYKQKLTPDSDNLKSEKNTISTPDNKYTIEVSGLEYKNTPKGDKGSIVVDAIISCNVLKKKYKARLKSKWEFEEIQDE